MKNIIYFSNNLNKNAGGPSGYLYNLREGINNINKNKEVEFIGDENEKINKNIKILLNNLIKKKLQKYAPNIFEKIAISRIYKNKNITSFVDEECEIIHFHLTSHFAYKSKQYPNALKLLTSHSPEASAIEICSNLSNLSYNGYKYNDLIKTYLREIDEDSFKKADYIIFPSKESMEPYIETIPKFNEIIKNKNIRFMMTGCMKLGYKLSKEKFRDRYNIPRNALLISYVGRHNSVKGYDILKNIFKKLEKYNKDIYFVIGGNGDIRPIENNKRWIEVGWTDDPGSIINASDLFILPNRRTYFDLILLEVLSTGTPVLASNTGGNKTVARFTEGIELFDIQDIDGVVKKILNKLNNKEKLKLMGKFNEEAYNKYFTIEKFAERYINLINEIKIDNQT